MDISTILIYLKDLLATVMTLLMMLSPAFGGNGAAYQAEKPEELVTSFVAVSDIHVETNNPDAYRAYYDLLEGIKGGENIDTVVYCGDNVMNGQFLENVFFYLGLRGVMPAENNIVVAGNHDFGNGTGNYDRHRNDFLANSALYPGRVIDKPYYYEVIDGCYMIVLASETDSVNDCLISDEQFTWLQEVLDQAAAEDATIFVINHHPVNYLIAESNDKLANVLNKYDNLFYIHGHVHNQLTKSSFYEWNGVKSINLPRSTEIVNYEPGDGIVVEVYENEILVRGRDFITGEWIDGLEYRYELTK